MDFTLDRHGRLSALITAAAAGDERAFTELHRLTHSYLHHVALRLLRVPSVADEVLQDAYLSIWLHAGSFRPGEGSPMTWLIAIVRHRALSVLRSAREGDLAWTGDDEFERAECAAEDAGEAETADLIQCLRLREAMGKLDPAHRNSLALAFGQEMTHMEMARHMAVPLGTVKSWVRRGLSRLRHYLEHPVDVAPLRKVTAGAAV